MGAPCFVSHYLDVCRCKFGVGGSSVQLLQAGMLRRFLNYNDYSRSLTYGGDLAMAIVRDAEDVVFRGYCKLFPLTQGIGKLSIVVAFEAVQISVVTVDLTMRDRFLAFMPVVVFPICVSIFMMLRSAEAMLLRERQEHAQSQMVKMVDEVVSHYQLIAAYFCRPQISDRFDVSIHNCNLAGIHCNIFQTHAEYFSKWLTNLIIAVYLVLGSKSVIDGKLPVGNFLATITIYKTVGAEMTNIYRCLISIQSVMASLRHIIRFLNLPTDLDLKYTHNLSRLKRSSSGSSTTGVDMPIIDPEATTNVHLIDRRRIIFQKVSFAYTGSFVKSRLSVFHNLELNLGQGRLTCILGAQRSGKTALLKLIGQALLPTDGILHVPAHLRV